MQRIILLLFCCYLLILTFNNSGWALDTVNVKAIDIRGNRRIETPTILAKIKTREGDRYRQCQGHRYPGEQAHRDPYDPR